MPTMALLLLYYIIIGNNKKQITQLRSLFMVAYVCHNNTHTYCNLFNIIAYLIDSFTRHFIYLVCFRQTEHNYIDDEFYLMFNIPPFLPPNIKKLIESRCISD